VVSECVRLFFLSSDVIQSVGGLTGWSAEERIGCLEE